MSYIFGRHAVSEFIKTHPENVSCLFLQSGKQSNFLSIDINKSAFRIKEISKLDLDQLVNHANHQGIVAEIFELQHEFTEHDLEKILHKIQGPPLLLILDGVKDPHNLGACLRVANAGGVHAVIAPKDNAVGLTPIVYKVASGAAQVTPFIRVTNLARTLRFLKENGIWLYAADEKAEETIFNADFKLPMALVLGAEGSGLRRLTKENCDFLVRIPMLGNVQNLNVSVSAGICLFEAVRQRTIISK